MDWFSVFALLDLVYYIFSYILVLQNVTTKLIQINANLMTGCY